jgi:Recombinase
MGYAADSGRRARPLARRATTSGATTNRFGRGWSPAGVPPETVERIRADRAAGKSLRRIAAELNADGTPTAHGSRWWPSTVRAVIVRAS